MTGLLSFRTTSWPWTLLGSSQTQWSQLLSRRWALWASHLHLWRLDCCRLPLHCGLHRGWGCSFRALHDLRFRSFRLLIFIGLQLVRRVRNDSVIRSRLQCHHVHNSIVKNQIQAAVVHVRFNSAIDCDFLASPINFACLDCLLKASGLTSTGLIRIFVNLLGGKLFGYGLIKLHSWALICFHPFCMRGALLLIIIGARMHHGKA